MVEGWGIEWLYIVRFLEWLTVIIKANPVISSVIAGILFLILWECVYIDLLKSKEFKKYRDTNPWARSIAIKIIAATVSIMYIFFGGMVAFLLEMIVYIIVTNWEIIVQFCGIAAIVVVFVAINKKVADKYSVEETEKEYKARMKKKEKGCKFKVGEKVRVNDDIETCKSYKERDYLGKIVTIDSIRGSSGKRFYIKEDDHRSIWTAHQVTKIKRKKRTTKK